MEATKLPSAPLVLIVDDERHMCRSLEILLVGELGCQVDTALNYYEALEKIKPNTSVVIADLTMPGKTGLDLLREIKKINPKTDVIMMTAHSTVESAVQALKEGALEYLIKPFASEKLLQIVEHSLKKHRQIKSSPINRYGDLIGASKAMQQVYDLIERSAQTDSTVLITGESGTGKELVARAVHFNGIRKRAPFISINCLALPENLLESELFGHEPGAFTEDLETKEGKFELADEGTIFLDEIGDLSSTLQVKLLRFLQEKEFERVGGSKTIKMNVRCIAATNRNLDTAMQEGTFREELYFRLNVFNIAVPALRDRREDIPLLVEYLIKKKAHQLKIPIKPVSTSAEKKLLNYSYPGNIRELENLLERALIVSRNRSIRAEDLVLSNVAYRGGDSQENLSQIYNLPLEKGWHHLQEINKNLERELLLRALTIHRDANNSEIAALLGTTRRILELRLKLFGLDKA